MKTPAPYKIIPLAIFMYTCCGDDDNRPPEIRSLESDPAVVYTNSTSTLVCDAYDPDGDNLEFNWELQDGTISGSGNVVTWSSPNTAGEYSITCRVSDGNGGEDSESIAIVVELPVPTEGLLAHYPFSGSAEDASENGNDGTVEGPALSADRFGNENSAYAFDGVDDYIDIPYDPAIEPAIFTLSLWINTTSETMGTLMSSDPNSNLCSHGYNLIYNQNAQYKIRYNVDISEACRNGLNVYSDGPVNDGNWHHICAMYDGSLKLYIDGVLQSTTVSGAYKNTTASIRIGMNRNMFSDERYYFHGYIDDIRMYDRALSEEEVQALYHENGWD